MKEDFELIIDLWKIYNSSSSLLIKAMNGTANEVGEFAEKIAAKFFGATQLTASEKSADLITANDTLIQVKSRKLKKLAATQLNVIRSWEFHELVIVLFSTSGNILKAIQINAEIAKNLAKRSKHQNGYILTTNQALLEHPQVINLTEDFQAIIDGKGNQDSTGSNRKMFSKHDSRPDIFSIELYPENEALFKTKLTQVKKAKRVWIFDDREETDIWKAKNFTLQSNLRSNILSNLKVRKRNETGLKKLILKIEE